MKNAFLVFVMLFCAVRFCPAGSVFDLNYSTYDPYINEGGSTKGNVTKTEAPVASIDFNNNGVLQIQNIAFPQSAFTIESRFFLRTYSELDPNISDILAAFDCSFDGMGGTEGVDFRVGGGYNYPLRPSDAYANVEEWIKPDYYTKVERAKIAKSIGEFVLGVGQHIWKEVYTDRCIETNAWTHMVATWDGKKMRIYLNGREATDDWRTNGVELPAYVKAKSTLFFGAENFDQLRHLDGKVEFVRIYDSPLSSTEILSKFQKSIQGPGCVKYIAIELPKCGEVIGPATKIKFSIPDSNDCLASSATYTYSLELCANPDFSQNVISFPISTNEFLLGEVFKGKIVDLKGLVFIRIVATGTVAALGKKVATMNEPVLAKSAGQPAYLIGSIVGTAPSMLRPLISKCIPLNNVTPIYDCLGRKICIAPNSSKQSGVKKTGIYFMNSEIEGSRKMVLVR